MTYIGLIKNKLNNIEKRIVLIEFDKIKQFFIGFINILFHVKTIRIVNYIYNHSRIFIHSNFTYIVNTQLHLDERTHR